MNKHNIQIIKNLVKKFKLDFCQRENQVEKLVDI